MGNGDDFACAVGIPLNDLSGSRDDSEERSDFSVGAIRVEGQRAPEHSLTYPPQFIMT